MADDDDANRYTLIRYLRRFGFSNILEATTGREAVDLVQRLPVDLVLLDVLMPGTSGYDVVEDWYGKGILSDLPVIMVSGVDDVAAVARRLELGAEDFLTKPLHGTVLRVRIDATLEKKQLRDEARKQLEVIRRVLGKYAPEAVARALVDGHGTLEPTTREVTILYTDIASFTDVSGELAPDRVMEMLNEYFLVSHSTIERADDFSGTRALGEVPIRARQLAWILHESSELSVVIAKPVD